MRLYVLVRADLAPAYQAVQAGHAVAQFMLDHPGVWNNATLVYLSVSDEQDLVFWYQRAREYASHSTIFREPDLEDAATAAAFFGHPLKNLLRRVPLLGK